MKISIPTPCHENWNAMPTIKDGKFCATCTRNLIDFSQKPDVEVAAIFEENRNEKICGLFAKSQLDSVTIQIPTSAFHQKMNFRSAFLLTLFASMGGALFSCSDDAGNKKTIDGVQISDEENVTRTHTLGIPAMTVEPDTATAIAKVPRKKAKRTSRSSAQNPAIPDSTSEDSLRTK
ncbi:MAG: hypothetical protein EOO50_09380 [Flavobacterium sp.]|uniref:hypothetical protein n=1 Tax=Flavobacterium sp. TaxID=239 RepID=UPI0012291D90|nr:hypothetical protein [Flavobacterium sp.]RZJ66574.1 MAG: hypothetical protein EOO50_09380 [Flavobacterium sp.]